MMHEKPSLEILGHALLMVDMSTKYLKSPSQSDMSFLSHQRMLACPPTQVKVPLLFEIPLSSRERAVR